MEKKWLSLHYEHYVIHKPWLKASEAEAEDAFNHGLCVLNHDVPRANTLRRRIWTNECGDAHLLNQSKNSFWFIHSRLTSPPACYTSSVYLYDDTSSEGVGMEVSSEQTTSLFSSSFSSSFLSESHVRGPPSFPLYYFVYPPGDILSHLTWFTRFCSL